MTISKMLVCPHCHNRLSLENKRVECRFCKGVWDIVDGIPHFAKSDIYWGEIPREDALRLIDNSKRLGWRHGVEEVLKGKYPDIYDYIVNDLRYEFRYMLPITNDSIVLDIGAGWGTISIGLSGVAREVYAVELIPERVEFIKIRAAQDNIKNLTLIMADMLKLPLPDDFFDCVVLNGVLEWVGLQNTSTDPRTVQGQFLKEIYRILKPGGYIYIGIENRVGYQMFRGAIDHSGLKYTSLMPRWLASLYCRLASKQGYRVNISSETYRTYTYSIWGYRKLLKDNLFTNIRFFMPLPSYNIPIEFVDLKDKAFISYYIRHIYKGNNLSLKGRIKKKLLSVAAETGMIPILSEDFSIIAQKAAHR